MQVYIGLVDIASMDEQNADNCSIVGKKRWELQSMRVFVVD